MPDTNAPSRRLEAGTVITLNNGVTTWTLIAVEEGTFRFTRGGHEALRWRDRATLKDPYRGSQRAGKVSFAGKFSGVANANDLYKALDDDGTNGLMPLWTLVVKWPDAMGTGVTGHQMTFAKCFVIEDGVEYQAGREFDTLAVQFEHNEVKGTPATY